MLSIRREKFVKEFVSDGNAARAARAAGYAKKSASARGRKLLRDPEVAAAVEVARAELMAKLNINAEQVLRELGRIAFADMHGVGQWP